MAVQVVSIKILAFGLVLIFAGINIILFSTVHNHHNHNAHSSDVDVDVDVDVSSATAADGSITKITARTDTTEDHHNQHVIVTSPSDLFRNKQKQHPIIRQHMMMMIGEDEQKKKKKTTQQKQQQQQQQRRGKTSSSSSSTYTCSYGPSGTPNSNNRTVITVPINTPSFILIGVQKSGTTALLTYFRDHPLMLQTKRKFRREAHFFDTSWYTKVINESTRRNIKQANDKHCLALDEYMKLFEIDTIMLANSETLDHNNNNNHNNNKYDNKNSTHQQQQLYTFEKTPSYFSNPNIPQRIKQVVPWSKTILILRNPIDRLYSQYKMTIKDVYNLRKYSIEDMIYHELKAMGKNMFNMTSISELPTPINGTLDVNAISSNVLNEINLNPGIPIIASSEGYKFPLTVNQNHPISSNNWIPKHNAINKYSDKGPLGHQILLRRGLYSIQLKWWLKHYTVNDDILIINYDDLLKDTYDVYLRILDFANIPRPPPPKIDQNNNNSTANTTIDYYNHKVRADDRKSERPLKNETRRWLSEFYRPYNMELEKLLGPKWSLDKLNWV